MKKTVITRGKVKKIVALGMPIALFLPFLWWVQVPAGGSGIHGMALYAAAITGFYGTVMLLTSYCLGTRSVTGTVFPDQAWLIKLHKKIGKYGTLLIFLHPVFIIISYSENFLYTLVPNLENSFEARVTFGRFAFVGLLIIWVTSALVRGKIGYRPWKYIHYLNYMILPAVLLHSAFVGTTLRSSSGALVYWYLLAFIYLTATILRARYIFGIGKSKYIVESSEKVNEQVVLLKLQAEGHQVKVHAGQYVYLQRGFFSEEHPFSVLDYDHATKKLTVAFKAYGRFTRKLARLAKGDRVLVDGGYGVFTNELADADKNQPVVFVAGGIGVTPFVKHVLDAAPDRQVWMFYANRRADNAAFRTVLKNKLGNRYIDVISEQECSGENVEKGTVTAQVMKKYLPDLRPCLYFLCGPKGMMKSVRDDLIAAGAPQAAIHSEEFGF